MDIRILIGDKVGQAKLDQLLEQAKKLKEMHHDYTTKQRQPQVLGKRQFLA